jgi:hypothetical protein
MDADCKASCLDWYGNARPLFIGNRVFASLGYELVQGSIEGGHIRRRSAPGCEAASISNICVICGYRPGRG